MEPDFSPIMKFHKNMICIISLQEIPENGDIARGYTRTALWLQSEYFKGGNKENLSIAVGVYNVGISKNKIHFYTACSTLY